MIFNVTRGPLLTMPMWLTRKAWTGAFRRPFSPQLPVFGHHASMPTFLSMKPSLHCGLLHQALVLGLSFDMAHAATNPHVLASTSIFSVSSQSSPQPLHPSSPQNDDPAASSSYILLHPPNGYLALKFRIRRNSLAAKTIVKD